MAVILNGKKKARTSPALTTALASQGITPAASEGGEGEEEEEEVTTTTSAAAEGEGEGGEGGEGGEPTTTTAATTTTEGDVAAQLVAANARIVELTAAATTQTAAHNAVLANLTAQLTAANTEAANLRVASEAATVANAAVVAGSAAMRPVVLAAISRLDTILNTESVGVDAMNAVDLTAHYIKLNEKFEKKYPVGGKSNTGANTDAKPALEAAPASENDRVLDAASNLTKRGK